MKFSSKNKNLSLSSPTMKIVQLFSVNIPLRKTVTVTFRDRWEKSYKQRKSCRLILALHKPSFLTTV